MNLTDDEIRVKVAELLGWYCQPWGKNTVQVFAPKDSKPRWGGEDKETNSLLWPTCKQTWQAAGRDVIYQCAPEYESSVDAALTLCDRLREGGWKVIADNIDDGIWEAEFFRRARSNNGQLARDPSLARAICLAFLKVKGEVK